MLDAAGQARAGRGAIPGRLPSPPSGAGAAWDAHGQSTKESAAIAVALAEIDDVELPDHEEDWLDERVDVMLADLVEPAKAAALKKLGEGERRLGIAIEWPR